MRQSDERDRAMEMDVFKEISPGFEESNEDQSPPADTGDNNDHHLLSAYSHGDEHAFEMLVKKYFPMVYAVAARQTCDLFLAEEVAQSVFLILSRKARGFSPSASVAGWLLRTTRFVCKDSVKMRRRRYENERKLAMNLEHQVQSGTEPNPMEVLLDEALQTLRPDEQAGIMARFFEGKDFQEIAQMFAISEHAARKRTARCLTKLQIFMAKRGARLSLPAIFGLLAAFPPGKASGQAVQSAMHAAVWKGKIAAGNASAALADRALRSLYWRFVAGLTVKLAIPLVIVASIWSVRELNRPVSYRLDKLGKAWAALDNLVAQHKQFVMQTPPNAPNYQAKANEDIGAIRRESSRVTVRMNSLLAAPDARNRLATFLTAELNETLKLDAGEKTAVFACIERRLDHGATFKDGMKFLANTTQAEAAEIKAMLSPAQQRVFDQIYGADGVLLFTYPKAVALGLIGP